MALRLLSKLRNLSGSPNPKAIPAELYTQKPGRSASFNPKSFSAEQSTDTSAHPNPIYFSATLAPSLQSSQRSICLFAELSFQSSQQAVSINHVSISAQLLLQSLLQTAPPNSVAELSLQSNSHYPALPNPKAFPADRSLRSSHYLASCGQCLHRHVQKRLMSTPKITLKVDRSLDAHSDRDKLLRPIFKIRDLILRQENRSIRVRYLEIKRKHIGLSAKSIGVRAFIKRYPNIFELYTKPREKQQWCRLSKAMLDLLEEEKQIYKETEDQIVLKLRKLLMMSKERRLKAGKIDFARKAFGFPEDFATRLAPSYPQFFRIVGNAPSPFIELVSWDEKLAISELEKRAKEEALKAGIGEIETRGQPLAFKITHSPGMFLKKKNLELLERWQKLPYVSPYQDYSWVNIGTAMSEKRIAAILHEVLSLTVEKKALMLVLGRFREEFGLPQSIGKLINRFPGIFYLSLKGNVKTVFLREGYQQSQLIEDHPLVRLRIKYAGMVSDGPRLLASQKEKAKAECKEEGTAPEDDVDSEEDIDGDEADSAASDSDFVDSECDEGGSEDEPDGAADNRKEGYQKEMIAVKTHRTQRKAKRETW